MPEAYPHDPEVLPHQHDTLEELFPKAFVHHSSDAGEAVSEADPLEAREQRLEEEKDFRHQWHRHSSH